eukprot:6176972-Pleurochrysis_carterae.AAC.2
MCQSDHRLINVTTFITLTPVATVSMHLGWLRGRSCAEGAARRPRCAPCAARTRMHARAHACGAGVCQGAHAVDGACNRSTRSTRTRRSRA